MADATYSEGTLVAARFNRLSQEVMIRRLDGRRGERPTTWSVFVSGKRVAFGMTTPIEAYNAADSYGFRDRAFEWDRAGYEDHA